jgi:hypothetical protein
MYDQLFIIEESVDGLIDGYSRKKGRRWASYCKQGGK